MHRVLTITLNPAIDITTAVPELVPGRKMRCEAQTIEPGGGGVNVSRVIKELGGQSTALVAIAGPTGGLMRDLLVDRGIESVFLAAQGMTRQSFAVHDRSSGEQYRFVLPGPVQDAAFAENAIRVLKALLSETDYPYVVTSGSQPPGLPDDFYGEIAKVVRDHGARLILDTSGPALRAALEHRVFLVKPDHIEAEALATELGIADNDPERLTRKLLDQGSAEVAIVTLGREGALIASRSGIQRIRPPEVEVVSKVGAGDSFIGALSYALSNDWPIDSACAYGVAAAAAAITTKATELAYKPDVDRLYAAMGWKPGGQQA